MPGVEGQSREQRPSGFRHLVRDRGAALSKHYRQAFDYWVRLVPDRPQYVILCNFDEFWVYDFNNQIDSPKDSVKLTELSTRWARWHSCFQHEKPPNSATTAKWSPVE